MRMGLVALLCTYAHSIINEIQCCDKNASGEWPLFFFLSSYDMPETLS